MNIYQIQTILKNTGFYKGEIDGDIGPQTRAAVNAAIDFYKIGAQGWNDNRKMVAVVQRILQIGNLYKGVIDGISGPQTLAALTAWEKLRLDPAQPSTPVPLPSYTIFDEASAKRLAGAHPLLQKLFTAARRKIAFTIMDSQRGRAAQEAAFKAGHSKAHFGQSAHNWDPAVACDLAPIPLDWNNVGAFRAVQAVIGWYDPKSGRGAGLAKEMKIPIRWGGDWNMDGNPSDGWDLPHYELHPWREFAKSSKPYQG